MKLVIAVIQDKDSTELSHALIREGFHATKLVSTGSFPHTGNTTFMIGTEDYRVQEVLEVIRTNCKVREKLVSATSLMGNTIGSHIPFPLEVQIGGATIFVVPVEHFENT